MRLKKWTPEKLRILDEKYADTPTSELSWILDIPCGQINTKAHHRGLKKSKEAMRTSRYEAVSKRKSRIVQKPMSEPPQKTIIPASGKKQRIATGSVIRQHGVITHILE